MHFIIDGDNGASIKGWLAPDNPSLTPTLVAVLPELNAEIEVTANVMRAGIRDLGLHATGLCGFDINTQHVPQLAQLTDVEILEAETRLPIYRRFLEGRDIPKKLFLFDCSIIPQRRILNGIRSRFALSYFNSERNGLETTTAIITNPIVKSVFISGRSVLMRYDQLLKEKGYLRAALLREPHEELAERLFFLNFLAKEDAASSLAAYTNGVASLLDFARDLPFNDPRALTQAFRTATEEQRRELASPMTRVFGCDVGEAPNRGNVSIALENLAALDVVGTRERYGVFKEMLAGVAGADVLGDEDPAVFESVRTFAGVLSRIGLVNDILAEDLALYSFVEEAISEGLRNPEGVIQRDTLG